MIHISDDRTFALSNRFFSYILSVTPEGLLEHKYYGKTLSEPLNAVWSFPRIENGLISSFEGVENLNLNRMAQEYPTFGRSDYRFPAFHGTNAHGNTIFTYLYKSHHVTSEKPEILGLPSARGGDSETLIVTLEDTLHNLLIHLYYTVYADHSVLARSAKIENKSGSNIQIQQAFSSSLDLPPTDYEILHLHGSYAREFSEERISVPHGRFVIESARGASSAAHNPFVAIMEKGATETFGEIYASTMIYSGNFAIHIERGEYDDVRCLIGINPFNFGWQLEPEQSFFTPEALHVYAGHGLGSMSHIWHNFIRDKISPQQFRHQPRPTYLNTWEAAYHDVSEEKVLKLADKAKEIGVEMLILDDGWFEGRNDARSSLGDWVADKGKFPSGMSDLAAKVRAKGLKFGLWFEPEMISPQSQLFENHPDWVLGVAGRKPSLSRHQLTLDLSRQDVVDHLFDKIDAILSCGHIDYVKWDMNRNMTETGSKLYPNDQQAEISHRYILGLYSLLRRITEKHPNILIENCASGGNRFDLGMLSFMAQAWPSDMCDPIGRLDIINGASYLFPMDVMTAYIGPSPNHINGRITSIQTRFLAGLFCAARGISLDETELVANKQELQKFTTLAQETATDMLGGRFDRLLKTENDVCWQFTTYDGSKVFVVYFQILSRVNQAFRTVKLKNLEPSVRYYSEQLKTKVSGDNLMSLGVPIKLKELEFDRDTKRDFMSELYVFERI